MARYMEVVGDGEEVLGEIMGEEDYGMGADAPAPHPLARRGAAGGHRLMRIPQKPDWRSQLAPGVIQPDEGMVPLVLQGQSGSPPGQFTASLPTIIFQGQLQKPYRAERLLVSTVRSTNATGRLLAQLFIGTDLMMADINSFDAELVGQPGSFGTRLSLKAAEPGVLIRMIITPTPAITTGSTDTIFASIMFLGRIIH